MARDVSEEELALTRKILKELLVLFGALMIPYVIIGVIWAETHSDHLAYLSGVDKFFSYAGEVVAWPVLTISDITLE